MGPRRLFRKKPAIRRRRPVRRGMIRRVPRGIPGVYRFKRMCAPVRIYHNIGDGAAVWRIEDPNVILNPTSLSGAPWAGETLGSTYQNQFGCRHALNQITASSDLSNLFDMYKITGVRATFLYQISEASASGGGVLPTILYAPDFDDSSPPSYNDLRQKQNAKQKILMANKPFSVFYRPKIVGSVQNSNASGTASASISNRGFLDSTFNQVDHYGMKFSLNNLYGTTAVASQFEIQFTYYLTMKGPQ